MRGWAAYFLAWVLALWAAPALGAGQTHHAPPRYSTSVPHTGAKCIAALKSYEPIETAISAAKQWDCGERSPVFEAERVAVRFELQDPRGARYLGTRPTFFEKLSLVVVKDGRVVATSSYADDELNTARDGRQVLVPLPDAASDGAADWVIAIIDHPSTRSIAEDARLYASDPTSGPDVMKNLVIAAIVCGMLIMPLAFNAAYYRVLRDRFVLWHLVLTGGLLAQCLLTSGILVQFVSIPVPLFSRLIDASFAIAVASAAGFCAAFIESGRLNPWLRLGLYLAGALVLAASLLSISIGELFGPFQTKLYYLTYLPVLLLFLAVMVDASHRGSRAIKFQIIGWLPFMIVGFVRIVTMVVPWLMPVEAMHLFYFAMVVESVATSLGVVDRFVLIRRERDRALSRASNLAVLSERDDLTGLYNRRALDGPLGNFAEQGFTGFALFDLDHFKRVNDTHGHATGDEVLRVAAKVLAMHENATAVRLGGEEFLLLLKGDQVSARVESLREAIPIRVAREVSGLETLVTASAGLVEAAPGRCIGGDFIALYRTADDLLYEAKHHGRNLLASVTLRNDAGAGVAVLAVA